MQGDGDGWVECSLGHRHWGRFGAAGLLLHTSVDGRALVLLQHRADWCHHGGTWGIPGGARDSHESTRTAALREAAEEAGVDADQVLVHREVVDDHGGWSYTTVLASVDRPIETVPNHESQELAWQPVDATAGLGLHPGFGATWPDLQATALHVVVDTANVVGSTPDGWWRDRPAATTRQLNRLATLVTRLVTLPTGEDAVVASVTAVLEGAARAAVAPSGVRVVRADASGDDALVGVVVDVVVEQGEAATAVVTADRELAGRLPARVRVVGPSWLRGCLTQ